MKSSLSNLITRACTILFFFGAHVMQAQVTTVSIDIPDRPVQIDPMIYGQMLENVNDSMIYGGVTDLQGNVRAHLIPDLSGLRIPVIRWPGGSVVHEYHWENGIGPRGQRPTAPNVEWGGVENYQFGTDEFLQWCEKVGTTPYINFNMSNHPQYKGSLGEALTWIEYVNGSEETPYGKLRVANGRKEPYQVLYWGLGNENYLSTLGGVHTKESETVYADKLHHWASAIRHYHPDLQLLGVGHTRQWNQTVLAKNGHLIDFLTQHYYVTSRVRDGKIENPANTLFAPAKMEAHLALLGVQLDSMNRKWGRADHPIRLSVDEWNNRHSVNVGDHDFKFTRHSPRRQFDVAVVAGMLNAFIRQSPHVGMANYIFPVNTHGLIRTVGNNDAYQTPIYHVFQQYRDKLVGAKIDVTVHGPSIATASLRPTIDGDSHEADYAVEELTFVDAAAVLNIDDNIYLSLVNRSHDTSQQVTIELPAGYTSESVWMLSHTDIHASNSSENRTEIIPIIKSVQPRHGKVTIEIAACGLHVLKLIPRG